MHKLMESVNKQTQRIENDLPCIGTIDAGREAVGYNADGTVTLAFEKDR